MFPGCKLDSLRVESNGISKYDLVWSGFGEQQGSSGRLFRAEFLPHPTLLEDPPEQKGKENTVSRCTVQKSERFRVSRVPRQQWRVELWLSGPREASRGRLSHSIRSLLKPKPASSFGLRGQGVVD